MHSPRLRTLTHVATAVVEVTIAWLALAPGLVILGMGIEVVTAHGPGANVLAAIAAGVVIVGLVSLGLAHPLTMLAERRLTPMPLRRRRWLDARGFVWLGVTLTLRAGILAGVVVVTVTSLVGLATPWLVQRGDRVDLGPWRVTSLPWALVVAGVGAGLLVAGVLALPVLTRADQTLARGILVGEEAELEQELADTATSRARIIDAHDQERRRIERDLHDGVQPELLGVSMTLGVALAAMSHDDPARVLVTKAQQQSLDTLDSLRRLVRGVHPQVLDDHGIVAALFELADTLPTPVAVDDRIGRRLPTDIEVALYYVVAELLTNVSKHAAASRAVVLLDTDSMLVRVRVEDDGIGGADVNGRGLLGVRDRLAAAGGSLDVVSPAGGPTRVTVTLPEQESR